MKIAFSQDCHWVTRIITLQYAAHEIKWKGYPYFRYRHVALRQWSRCVSQLAPVKNIGYSLLKSPIFSINFILL